MRAALREVPLVEDDQAVRVAQRRETVRDGEGRAVLRELVDRVLDQLFRLGVERGGRFVEDQDLRVVDQRAGDRHSLTFTAGEGIALLADHCVVAVREIHDEVVRVRHLRRLDDFLVGGVGLRVLDVVADRAGEEVRLLQHDADLGAQRVLRDVLDVDVVDHDRAFRHIVQTHQEIDEGRLAGAGMPDHADHLALLHVEVDALEDRVVGVIAEGHVLEPDVAFDVDVDREADIRDLGLFLEDLQDLAERGEERGDLARDARDPEQRPVDDVRVGVELVQVAVVHRALEEQVVSVEEDEVGPDPRHETEKREERVEQERVRFGLRGVAVRAAVEGRDLALLIAVGLDHADAVQDVL